MQVNLHTYKVGVEYEGNDERNVTIYPYGHGTGVGISRKINKLYLASISSST